MAEFADIYVIHFKPRFFDSIKTTRPIDFQIHDLLLIVHLSNHWAFWPNDESFTLILTFIVILAMMLFY